jgi:hypothetical protein
MTPFVPLFWLSLVILVSRFVAKTRLAKIIVWVLPLSAITALVYLANDVSNSRKLAPHWTSLDTICQRVPAGGSLGSLLTSSQLNLMLEVKFDQSIPTIPDPRKIPPDLRFLVADTNTVMPACFSRTYIAGPFVLLQRSPPQTGDSQLVRGERSAPR